MFSCKKLPVFWGYVEKRILIVNLAGHIAITLIGLLFMPLPFFSEFSLHDGNTYFQIAQNLWPDHPFTNLSWHKRILLPVLANLTIPVDKHLSFLVLGILPTSISAVFFYKIASRFSQQALALSWIYSSLPWLVFSAHHALNEPLMMFFLLAGFYYFLENRPILYIPLYALAILSKEIAIFAVISLGIIILIKKGVKPAILFSLSLLPFAFFCLVYGFLWKDCNWCLQVESVNSFSWKPGLVWIWRSLFDYVPSSANLQIARLYNLFNQVLNLTLLTFVTVGIVRLQRYDKQIFWYSTLLTIPLFFLGPYIYSLNVNLGRQFLISSLALIGYSKAIEIHPSTNKIITKQSLLIGIIAGSLTLSMLWIIMYSKYFIYHKIF